MTNFVSQLRAYLLELDGSTPRDDRDVATVSHRAFFYREMEAIGVDETSARHYLAHWTRDRIDAFVAAFTTRLTATIAHDASGEELSMLVEDGIRLVLGAEATNASPLRRQLLAEIASEARRGWVEPVASVAPYAFELRLTRRAKNAVRISPIGIAWLSTPGSDALQMLLALELTQALGRYDEFRLSQAGAQEIVVGHQWLHFDDRHGEWPAHNTTLVRLASLGLVTLGEEEDEGKTLAPTPLGRAVLEETSSPSSPWRLVAQALVDEERGALTSSLVPAFRRAEADSLRDARTREAEALAHEVRNALVPVPTQLDRLYQALDRAHPGFDLAPYRALIDPGVARVFEYVDARLQAAAILEAQREIDLVSAIERLPKVAHRQVDIRSDATLFVSGTNAQIQSTISELESNARSVEATANLWVTLEKKNGYAHLIVEDNGPGIADVDLPRVFERGFSRRGSSGHGLAIVRDRVVNEMGGRIEVGPSTHGGARFLMIFPLSTRTS